MATRGEETPAGHGPERAGVLAVIAGTGLFLLLAGLVMTGATQQTDEAVLRALRTPDGIPHGPLWLREVARDITALGGHAVLFLTTAGVLGFLALDRRPGAVRFVAASVLGGYLLGMTLKRLFSRERPDELLRAGEVFTSSFPSGHAMMSAVVYLTLAGVLATMIRDPRLKRYVVAVAVLATLLIGSSRIYIGVHFPTDVLAGWSVGCVWAVGCWMVARRLQRRGTVEREL